jgi:hypothetical protein
MRPLIFVFLFLGGLLQTSCRQAAKNEGPATDPVLEKIAGKDYASLIQIPTTPEGQVDTAQMAQIRFHSMVYDFDTLFQGDKASHEFVFENTGKKELYILQTNSSCGCTVSSYSKAPIPPGNTGTIQVEFDSTRKNGRQNRRIAVLTNAFPSESVLRMTGFVKTNE